MERLAITMVIAFGVRAIGVRVAVLDECETLCLTPIARGESVQAVCSLPVCTSCTICSGGVGNGTTACEIECTTPISTKGENPEVVCRKSTCRSCSICTGGLPNVPVASGMDQCETECNTPISRGEDPEYVCGKPACTACSICTGRLPEVIGDADCETECTTPISNGEDIEAVCGKATCKVCSICTNDFPEVTADADCETECTTPISNGEDIGVVCGKPTCKACSICTVSVPVAHGTPVVAAETDCQKECETPISKGENLEAVCGKPTCKGCSICTGSVPVAHGTPVVAADTDCQKECETPISKGENVEAVCSKAICFDCEICSLDDVRPVFTDCAEMYREQQDKQKCGLHAVNNVIRNSLELPEASRVIKEAEMRQLSEDLFMPAGPDGGFGYSVVFSALEKRFKGSDVDVNIVGGSLDGRFVPKTIEEHIAGLAESNASARLQGRGIAMSLADADWVVVNDATRGGGGHYYTYFRLNDYTFCNLDSIIQHDIAGHVLPAKEIPQCALETKQFAAIIFPSPKFGIERRSRQATPVYAEIRPLVEMGFSSDDSCKAYIKARGDLQVATKSLLGS